ncbi:MAG: autorepressor SdpR family transcription factor [Oscillospiraceae bacterium]|nr:autorepressor SdpR family transcription factor [Oscillospiraceae bacterium]
MGFENTCRAIADPVRREILFLLKGGKLSAGEIGANFDMTAAAVSYHLNILKKADLVSESRYKNFIYYELNTTVLDEMILWIENLKGENIDEKEHEAFGNTFCNGVNSDSCCTDSSAVSAS